MTKIAEKKCNKCGKVKPREAFSKNKNMPDGRCAWCKDCQKDYYDNRSSRPSTTKSYELHDLKCECEECEKRKVRIDKSRQGRGKADLAEVRGIENWNQVGSVLRELAELQSGINEEEVNYEKRVSMIRKYSDEVIEPHLAHQINLQTMLQNFLKKDGRKRLIRKYNFGVIKLFRGRLKIQLDADLAKQKMGMP
jgi:hypothetical protein